MPILKIGEVMLKVQRSGHRVQCCDIGSASSRDWIKSYFLTLNEHLPKKAPLLITTRLSGGIRYDAKCSEQNLLNVN